MSKWQPLATRMRPKVLADYVGQQHLLGQGKSLQLALQKQHYHSMIFWGPPGTGKTTLAYLIANAWQAEFVTLSAVTAGVKDIRAIIETAKLQKLADKKTILFVDEIHRFNKSQQDVLLPHVEAGDVILIGATTENPSFEINNALLSRCRVYVLKSLTVDDILQLIARALADSENGLGNLNLQMPPELQQQLAEFTDGDARRALNLLEMLADLAADDKMITAELLQEVLQNKHRQFDKQGEYFYDQISALHKAVRGSSPDASLYWLVRMLDGGVDPYYLGRRIIRMANEDIGNADPRALQVALDAVETYERLGSPEGELALAQAVIYMACAPKSNAVYMAFKAAQKDVGKNGTLPVPLKLRNAPTKLMKSLDYGSAYRYAHDEPNAYAAGENYFPDEMTPRQYYFPTSRGLEKQIEEKLKFLRELDAKARKEKK